MKGNQQQNFDILLGNNSELDRQSEEKRKIFDENEELQAAIEELNEDYYF